MSGSVAKHCEKCGKEFYVYPYQDRAGGGRFCSRECSGHAPAVDRFWRHVNKSGSVERQGIGRCWEWTAGSNKSGYGTIGIKGRSVLVHRFSYELHHGPLGELLCCHRCDNKLCVNPSHLFAGTHMDNYNDMVSKGRMVTLIGDRNGSRTRPEMRPRGSVHARSKLSESDVLEIRASNASVTELRIRYGVADSTIREVISRKHWKHI